MGRSGFVIVCCDRTTVMKVTTSSEFVWIPPNNFNLHWSTEGNISINHVCICHQCGFQPTCETTKSLKGGIQLVRTAVIHASGDMLSPLARFSVSRHQVVSRQSAGMQMCPQQRFNCYDSPICHRICSLPTALGPKLVSEQDIPAVWWIHPLPALSSPVSDRRVSFLPFPPSFAPLRPSHLYASVLYFSQRNISQQGCAQQGPKPRLQRTSHYPSRWCANVAVDIKVFQLIIIRGIHCRQLSLSCNLATIRSILVQERQCNAMVTLSWGQQSDTCW